MKSLLIFILSFSFIQAVYGQLTDSSLVEKMDYRYNNHLDSAQIIINYAQPEGSSKKVVFNKDKSGAWHGKMLIVRGRRKHAVLKEYQLEPKRNWQEAMAMFYKLGIDTLHTSKAIMRDGSLNSILSRHDGKSNYVKYGFFRTRLIWMPLISFPLNKKKFPNEHIAAKIFKLNRSRFSYIKTERFKLFYLEYKDAVKKDNLYSEAIRNYNVVGFSPHNNSFMSGWLYGNGKLAKVVSFTDFKKEGTEKGYYKTGVLEFEIPYKANKMNGNVKWYYPDGKLKSVTVFVNDNAGETTNYDENGNEIKK
jgi:antitoxin component YwqK of YwqJK toxin-antitoxin module